MVHRNRGAGASPLRQLTPQNQNKVEVSFWPPREANIFKLPNKDASGVPAVRLSAHWIYAIETTGVTRLKRWMEVRKQEPVLQNLTDEDASSTFFGINWPYRIATNEHLFKSQAPIERRMADAIDSLKLLTSPALSASTITRAKVSVPE